MVALHGRGRRHGVLGQAWNIWPQGLASLAGGRGRIGGSASGSRIRGSACRRVPFECRARVLWAVCASRCCRVTGLTRGRWPLLLFFASCPRPSSSPRSLSPRPPVPFNPPELPAPLIPVVAHDVLHSPFRRSLLVPRHPGSSCRLHRQHPRNYPGTPVFPCHRRPFPHAPISHIQCQPVQLTWASTGAKTYNVALVSSANPCDDVM